MATKKRQTVSMRMPVETRNRLSRLARENNQTIGDLLLEMIDDSFWIRAQEMMRQFDRSSTEWHQELASGNQNEQYALLLVPSLDEAKIIDLTQNGGLNLVFRLEPTSSNLILALWVRAHDLHLYGLIQRELSKARIPHLAIGFFPFEVEL